MRRFVLLVAGLALLAGFAASMSGGGTQAEARWVITDLGTLGGRYSEALVINDHGQVAGNSDTRVKGIDGEPVGHAFLWQKGKIRDLGTLPGRPDSWPQAINDRGQIVGYAQTKVKYKQGEPEGHAFLWEKGRMRDLGTLGGLESGASDINERGQIVGGADVRGGDEHAFLWQAGKMRDLGVGTAVDINDRGEIVGWSEVGGFEHAVLWQDGKRHDLGTLPGGWWSRAVAINERSEIVGASNSGARDAEGTPVQHAFLWQNGKMLDLGTLGGSESATDEQVALNGHREVIGVSDIKTQKSGTQLQHAFLWQKGRMRDLGTLGGEESVARALNERGQIVGWSYTRPSYSAPHAFVWQGGKMLDLGGWMALAINDRSQVVGYSAKPHAVLWTLKP